MVLAVWVKFWDTLNLDSKETPEQIFRKADRDGVRDQHLDPLEFWNVFSLHLQYRPAAEWIGDR